MKITMIGSGYVGLVTGACLAEVGNDVLCLDIDVRKVDILQKGEVPIHEPGLAPHRRAPRRSPHQVPIGSAEPSRRVDREPPREPRTAC